MGQTLDEYPYPIPYKKNCYSQEMIDAVTEYMESGARSQHYHNLEECRQFEVEFADFCGRRLAVSTSSGTASLHIALLSSAIGEGDEVLLTPHVAYAVGNAVLAVGARPVFVDIDDATLTIDPSKIEETITANTKAMIPVHTYGHPADMDPIMEIARQFDLLVIEDATHAVGSKYKGQRLPFGGGRNVGFYSFNMKQFWLPSGGGMLVTDDEEVADRAREYRDAHEGSVVGYPYCMADSAAVVGRIQLGLLDEYVAMQRSSADLLNKLLDAVPVATPTEKEWACHAFGRYVIRAPMRDTLMKFLVQQGIDCDPLYPVPTHLLELYRRTFGYERGDFPITENEKTEELSLPEPRFRSRDELERIAETIAEFYDEPVGVPSVPD